VVLLRRAPHWLIQPARAVLGHATGFTRLPLRTYECLFTFVYVFNALTFRADCHRAVLCAAPVPFGPEGWPGARPGRGPPRQHPASILHARYTRVHWDCVLYLGLYVFILFFIDG
jgi:hypothetical protein